MVPDVVLVTGVSRFLGAHVAARLAANSSVGRVLGVDTVPPARDLLRRMGRTEFVRADIRNPLISRLIERAQVDTVVHTGVDPYSQRHGHAVTREMNVLGTMQLLAACQKSESVRKLVVKSTSAVYGASSRDPAVFTEDTEPRDVPESSFAKDATDIEGYVRGFGRRRGDVHITTLRFVNLIGPRIDALLTRYFSLPVVPTMLGYDARLQLLHSEDALAVLEAAVVEDLPGVFNVAAEGVLMLSQAIRRAGRVAMPVPTAALSSVSRVFRSARLADFSADEVRFLNLGRVVDTTRLREQFGFAPRWTTRQAFDDFVRGRDLRPAIDPDHVRSAERAIGSAVHRLW